MCVTNLFCDYYYLQIKHLIFYLVFVANSHRIFSNISTTLSLTRHQESEKDCFHLYHSLKSKEAIQKYKFKDLFGEEEGGLFLSFFLSHIKDKWTPFLTLLFFYLRHILVQFFPSFLSFIFLILFISRVLFVRFMVIRVSYLYFLVRTILPFQ